MLRVVVMSIAALAACAPTQVVRTDIAARPWHEVRSAYLTMYTDLDPTVAEARVVEMQHWRDALATLYDLLIAPDAPPPVSRSVVIHLASCADLSALLDEFVGGAAVGSDFEARRTMVTCEHPDQWWRSEVIIHELAHLFSFHAFPDLPPWLEEGLAEWFQTLQIDSGFLIVGLPSRARGPERRRLPEVSDLLAMGPDAFYRRRSAGYLVAWRLVHLLLTRDEYRPPFQRMLRAIADGTPTAEAWRAELGHLSLDDLDRQCRHLGQDRIIPLRYQPRQAPTIERRTLSRGEAYDVWLRAIATFAPPDRRARYVREQLALAAAEVPDWAAADYWRAVLAMAAPRDPAAAEASLRRYVAAVPDDVRGWIGLVRVALSRITGDPLAADPPDGLDDLADEVLALLRRARTAPAHDALATYFAVRRMTDAGLRSARIALRIDPSCARCEETYALLLYRAGQPGDAVAHQARAIRLYGESGAAAHSAHRLRVYRDAAARDAR